MVTGIAALLSGISGIRRASDTRKMPEERRAVTRITL
jgi:hypothetical protein